MELNEFVDLLFKKAREAGFSEYEVYYVDRESLSIGIYKGEVEKYNLRFVYIRINKCTLRLSIKEIEKVKE